MKQRGWLSTLGEQWRPGESGPLERALELARQRDGLIDLVGSTLQDVGFQSIPPERLRAMAVEAIHEPTVRGYAPDALGQLSAREAVSAWYGRRGCLMHPERVVLTPGTSFGYLMALRLLCERGDEILVPSPGYPLLDDLAAVAGVKIRHWHLRESGGNWALDPEEIRFQITPRTRAIALVSPHNPTGHLASEAELSALAGICQEHRMALLFDEVFSEWLGPGECMVRPEGFPLVVTFNGISKMLALPQWKLAWAAVAGEERSTVADFMGAAAHFTDTFLPLPELQQAMAPKLLADEAAMEGLADFVSKRRSAARSVEGLRLRSHNRGSYLCVGLPAVASDVEVATRLILEKSIHLHPGSYYGLPEALVTPVFHPDLVNQIGIVADWLGTASSSDSDNRPSPG